MVILDLILLATPTRWMGSALETALAAGLALATGLVWIGLRFSLEES